VDEDSVGATGPPVASPRSARDLVALIGLKHLPTRHGASFTVAGEAVALFRAGDRVWAVEDRNPYTACGIAGGRLSRVGHTPVVVSPMYHLVFDLRTGACLNAIDLPQQRLRTFAVELIGDVVHVGPAFSPRAPLAELSIGA
jgi:nitrite reductase (NADH) small subunit